jgi:hypothetical protein
MTYQECGTTLPGGDHHEVIPYQVSYFCAQLEVSISDSNVFFLQLLVYI